MMLRMNTHQMKVFEGQTFTIHVPDDWHITSVNGGQTLFAEPREPAPKLSVAVAMRPARETNTVYKLALITIESHQTNYPEYRVINNKSFLFEGKVAQLLRYRWYNGKFNIDVYQTQLMILENSILHTVTTTYQEGIDEADVKLLDTIRESFRLTC